MTAVLIIATLSVMALGYFVMVKLDGYISGPRGAALPVPRERVTALLYGADDDLCALLSAEGISFRIATRPELPVTTGFSAFVALSHDDLDNLAMCNRVKHVFPEAKIIALCNDSLYMDMYEEAAGSGVLSGRPNARDVLVVMKGELSV